MATVDDLRAEWDASAAGWSEHERELGEHGRPVRERILELAEAQPGESVLELAAGLGGLSRELLAAVGPDGRVVCSDLSPEMVAAARSRAAAGSIEHRVLDAQRLDLDDDSFDLVVCKMGLMLMPDPAGAAAECRRVLRSDGRLVVATWGPLEHNLWIATFGAAMLTHGHTPVGDPNAPGGIFSLPTPEAVSDLLAGAGFTDVETETIDAVERVGSFDHYWQVRSTTSGPLTSLLQELDEEETARIRRTCEEYAEGHRRADGSYEFPGQAVLARAR